MNLVVTDLYDSATTFEFNYNNAWGGEGFARVWRLGGDGADRRLYAFGGPYSHRQEMELRTESPMENWMTFVVQRRGDNRDLGHHAMMKSLHIHRRGRGRVNDSGGAHGARLSDCTRDRHAGNLRTPRRLHVKPSAEAVRRRRTRRGYW